MKVEKSGKKWKKQEQTRRFLGLKQIKGKQLRKTLLNISYFNF